jgi:hypothetical protein
VPSASGVVFSMCRVACWLARNAGTPIAEANAAASIAIKVPAVNVGGRDCVLLLAALVFRFLRLGRRDAGNSSRRPDVLQKSAPVQRGQIRGVHNSLHRLPAKPDRKANGPLLDAFESSIDDTHRLQECAGVLSL